MNMINNDQLFTKKEVLLFFNDSRREKINASCIEIFDVYAICGINTKLFMLRLPGC